MPRDADSHISLREQAAVLEWQSHVAQEPLHVMRDNPHHSVPILGGMFGLNLTRKNSRNLWKQSWNEMLSDSWAKGPRSARGLDQELLQK